MRRSSRPAPPRPRRALALLLVAALVASLAGGGCAFFNEENRYVSTWLDENVRPRSTAARVAVGPFALVGGLLGYGIDGYVIHPVVQVYDTARITHDHVWRGVDVLDFLDAALVPLRVAYTPVVFGIVYVWRVVFPLDRYVSDAEREAASNRAVAAPAVAPQEAAR